MGPLAKKAIAAVAIKEGIERIQEMRRPKKPSVAARLGKLVLIGGAVGGLYVAYKNGLFRGLTERLSGSERYEGYEGALTVQEGPIPGVDVTEQPTGSPS